jgi:hypothetical protein
VISFPGASHIACVLVCIFVSGTLTFAGLVMGWFVSFVKSDITGGNSEFAFCKFSGAFLLGDSVLVCMVQALLHVHFCRWVTSVWIH